MTPAQIKTVRLKLRLSQAGLAARLGVSQGAVSQWESGKKQISKTAALLLGTVQRSPLKKYKGKGS